MSCSGRRTGLSAGGLSCLIVVAFLLSLSMAQAAPTPPEISANTAPLSPTQPPRPAVAPIERTAPASVVGIDDPMLIPNRVHVDFNMEPEYSNPHTFSGGWLVGNGEIRVTGSSWATWNPDYAGIHVLFAYEGVYEVHFTVPQNGAGVVAEPNNFGVHEITVEALDHNGVSLGSYTRSITGYAGAAFIGVLSDKFDISALRITSDAGAAGYAFTDISFSGYAQQPPWGWVFYDVNGDGWRNPEESNAGLANAQIRVTKNDETVQTLHTWAPYGYYELSWEPQRPYCVTLDLAFQYRATTPTTSCIVENWDWVPSFGVLPHTGMLDGIVFRDWNGNAVRDAGEAGIAGAAVELWPAGASAAVLTATSGADGGYAFDMLPAGTYTVKVATTDGPLAGLAATGPNPRTEITLADGQHVTGVDFGYRLSCTGARSLVYGRVWRDENGNAAEDAGEGGLVNVRVCAEPMGWAGVFRCGRTDAQGRFELCVVSARQLVTVDKQPGLSATTPEFQIVDTPGAPYVHFGYR